MWRCASTDPTRGSHRKVSSKRCREPRPTTAKDVIDPRRQDCFHAALSGPPCQMRDLWLSSGRRNGNGWRCPPSSVPAPVLPDVELLRGPFTALNRFHAGAGPCRSRLYKWSYAASPLCDCVADHIVNHFDLTARERGLAALNNCADTAMQWLKDLRGSIR